MAKKYRTDEIPSANYKEDWGGSVNNSVPAASDESNILPYSGEAVQKFIKDSLQRCENKIGYFKWSNSVDSSNYYHLYGFKTKDDYEEWNAGDKEDPEIKALLLLDETLQISTIQGDSYAAYLYSKVSTTANIVVADKNLEVPFRFCAVRTSSGERLNVGSKGTLIVQRKTSTTSWTTVATLTEAISSTDYAATDVFTTINIGEYLVTGSQNIRIQARFEYEDGEGKTQTQASTYVAIGASVVCTQLSLTCNRNWQTPIYASTQQSKGFPCAYMVYGAVDKTLHIEITGGSNSVLSAEYALTAAQDSTVISKTITDATDTYKLWTHGVKTIKAWLTCDDGLGNTLSSQTLVNRFMVVNPVEEVDKTTPYIMVQNLVESCDNYTQADLCQYAVYSPGADGITNDGEDVTTVFYLTAYTEDFPSGNPTQYFRIEQAVTPGTTNTLNTTVEIESEVEDATNILAYFRIWRREGDDEVNFMLPSMGVSNAVINVDNSESYAPKSGADFVLNPKTRNNSESNPARIVNAKTGQEIESSWDGFDWIKDGWVTSEDDGQRVLRVPAGAKVNFKYNPFAQFLQTADSALEIELDFKVRNVTNEDDPIISLFEASDSSDSSAFKGLKMLPLKGEIHTKNNAVSSETDFNWRENKRTHISINIHNAVVPNNGDALVPSTSTYDTTATKIALVRVFVNGDIEREYKYSITDTEEFCTAAMSNGGFTLGQNGADIDIYGIRIYQNNALESSEVYSNYISTLPTAAEKQAARKRNDILTSGKIDINKCRGLGIRCLVWHGTEPYKENTSKQAGYFEVFQYDKKGNYLPEYSGTLAKDTVGLRTKRQGSTANTYYYSNIQVKMGDVEGTIDVPLSELHESISYEIKEAEGDDGVVVKTVALKGGCLGKNYPIDEKAVEYPYVDINGQDGVQVPDGWVDGNGKYRGMGYKIADGIPMAQKLVNKINYASSMQSHLPGVNNLYNDLHKAIVGKNSLQEAYSEARVSKYTEPFLFFTQAEGSDTPVYRGPCTFGAGKMDKPTWGYVKKLHPMFAMFEGSDNNYDLTDMRVPFTWNCPDCPENITYLPGDDYEGFFYNGQQCIDFDAGATDDDETPKVNIISALQNAWNFLFLHSPMVQYYKGTFDSFQVSDDAKNTFNKYWCTDGNEAFILKRYDFVGKKWVDAGLWDDTAKAWKQIDLRTYEITAATYTDSSNKGEYKALNAEFKGAIVAHAKKYIGWYFKKESLQLYYTLIIHMLAGTDSCSKNTYFVIDPKEVSVTIDGETKTCYLMEMHTDDVDTMLPIDNNGRTTKPYYIDRMHPYVDGDTTTEKYEGMHNVLFNLCEEMWEGTLELQSMAKRIFKAMEGLVSESDYIEGFPDNGMKVSVIGCLWKYIYFIQKYIPQVAYNEAARIRYEYPEMLGFVSYGSGARGVRPITQSNGSLLECELQFIERRIVLMASYAGWGPFGSGKEGNLGVSDATESFSMQAFHAPDSATSLNQYKFTVTPHQYLYPTGMLGQTTVDPHVRVAPGESYSLDLGSTTSNDTGMSISGINYYRSIGNLGDLSTTPANTITVNGKRLTEFVANPSIAYKDPNTGMAIPAFRPGAIAVTAKNLKKFSIQGCAATGGSIDLSNESRLEELLVGGTLLTSVTLPETHTLTTVELPSTITSVEITKQVNVTALRLDGCKNLVKYVVTNNTHIDTYSHVTSMCSDGAPLKTLKITNIAWKNATKYVINRLAAIDDCVLTGTIFITNNTDNRPSFNDKMSWLERWGAIDDKANALYITYYVTALTGFKIIGDDYTYHTGEYVFNCVPAAANSNNVVAIRWELENTRYATAVSQRLECFTIHVSEIGDEDTVAPTGTIRCYITTMDGDEFEASFTVGFYPRKPKLGDYVFYDGSWSDNLNSGKTVIGLCFYINPMDISDRRMVSVQYVTDYGNSLMGLNSNSSVLKNIELTDTPKYNVYSPSDIATVQSTTTKKITSAYLDAESIDGFVHTATGFMEDDGIANGSNITGMETIDEELAQLSGCLKAGAKVPVGMANTLKYIRHRNLILKDSGINLPIPKASDAQTEDECLTRYMENVASLHPDAPESYKCFYWPAVSRCYAFEPIVSSTEVLADKFRVHNWYLPSSGEMVRMYWYTQGFASSYGSEDTGDIFAKAKTAGYAPATGGPTWASSTPYYYTNNSLGHAWTIIYSQKEAYSNTHVRGIMACASF